MMHQRIGRSSLSGVALLGLLMAAAPGSALGSPSLSYTVTDLGPGRDPFMDYQYTNGEEHVFSTDGLAYPFQTAPALRNQDEALPYTHQSMVKFPPPWTTGASYDEIVYAYTNRGDTIAAYTKHVGRTNEPNFGYFTGYLATKGADGVWTRVADFGTHSAESLYGGTFPYVEGLNNLNQALVMTGTNTWDVDSKPHVELYDAGSGTMLDLTQMLADRWTNLSVYGLDESGRILLTGEGKGDEGGAEPHVLLLTPDGVSIDPAPVPEPGLIAFIACAAVGCVVRRSKIVRRPA